MADIKYYDVILKPVITEKSMNAMSDKKYTFMVHVDANKASTCTMNVYFLSVMAFMLFSVITGFKMTS